jgi:hypothetical protein
VTEPAATTIVVGDVDPTTGHTLDRPLGCACVEDGTLHPVPSLTLASKALRDVARMRSWPDAEAAERTDRLIERIRSELEEL